MTKQKDIVMVFNTKGMNSSEDQALKDNLEKNYLTLLPQMQPLPAAICFIRTVSSWPVMVRRY